MHLMPLYEKIVVEISSKQEITSTTGLVIQKDMSNSRNVTMTGTVVAVGEGKLLNDGKIIPLKVNVGDKVIFTKMTGETYNDGEKEYVILSESNVLSKIIED